MPTLLPPFTIEQPRTLNEASEMLLAYGEAGCAYAGGTELLLAMKQAGLRYEHLVDLKTIPDLDAVAADGSTLRIGALATHLALERSPLVRARLPALAELVARIANPRVRATGTLGGNLCFAEPHSDPATLLLCLETRLRVVGPAGARELAVNELVVGPFETSLAPGELLEAITVPCLRSGQWAGYRRLRVHERPTLGLALILDVDDQARQIDRARVAIGSASPTPRRSLAAEALLVGPIEQVDRRLDDAAGALADEAELDDDLEGSAEYKRHLIRVFLRDLYREAKDNAGQAKEGAG
jgi:aerobic carbon-monoxide dehydrogenase medium subunit